MDFQLPSRMIAKLIGFVEGVVEIIEYRIPVGIDRESLMRIEYHQFVL